MPCASPSDRLGSAGAPTASGDNPSQEDIRAWQVSLGTWIKGTPLFRHMLDVFLSAEEAVKDPVLWDEFVRAVSSRDPALYSLREDFDRETVLGAFLALLGLAREKHNEKAVCSHLPKCRSGFGNFGGWVV